MMEWPKELTNENIEMIKELKNRTIDEVSPKMLEDETLFYRFAKARDFNLSLAEAMLKKHISWRKDIQLDAILPSYTPPQTFKEYVPATQICLTKDGLSVWYVDIGNFDFKGLSKSTKIDDMIIYLAYIMEKDLEQSREQSKKHGKFLTKGIYVHNHQNLTLAKVTDRNAIELLLKMIQIIQDYYPERLEMAVEINTSVPFNMVYSIVKRILASEILKKVRMYGIKNESWKELFLELINPDDLPAFLGGNKTDPDGNPHCNTFIVHGQLVPSSYYLKQSSKSLSTFPDVKKITILPFSTAEINCTIEDAGCYLLWELEANSGDIEFSVFLKESNSNCEQVIPKNKLDAEHGIEKCVYKCKKVGTYTLLLDNSYSWFRQKEIFYRLQIRSADDMEKSLGT